MGTTGARHEGTSRALIVVLLVVGASSAYWWWIAAAIGIAVLFAALLWCHDG
ncbi:hypothetical protein [Mycobacterium sp.]|uniref:hypothetical protein n=1 Tax=Mycobacterium sp. TaxID=1785 RepID=UPI003C707446